MNISIADTHEDILGCYEVLSQLRPHIAKDDFLNRILSLADSCGYKLAWLEDNGIKAVVGYRISDWLHTGKYLEIEDLITTSEKRSSGYGGKLFDWILEQAKVQGCNQVHLVSGVRREQAHKFYIEKGMTWEAKYFSINV
ncbi:GNAT family N-acetyltransferase [Microbulbifer sp. OS29]|uniref:GNAT family N-acetyltransferase n=1 Tax=Microbulbifer okhotskensis TaxID=2926617 RepID=A0A9X2ER07_9GAMM|nr:GNAT family N-acetyltransferase [Microbulbifer okhotskensis]MCO1336782.1 GNAT family N-acetyltransferase [Microbulbifer okhotskensis]